METARCRAVLAAAETGSFSKAAEVLRYTPSGVNQLVTALESELGFSIFRRSTKGVALTENGQILLPTVREFLRQEDRLFELATEINGLLIGSVTIAAYSSIATHWLPAVIRAFQKERETGTFSRKEENEEVTMILATENEGGNRVYMLQYSGRGYHRGKATIIIKPK